MLYLTTLTLHNLMRWVTLAAALWALYRAFRGWIGARPWSRADQRAGRWFALALSVQLLIGGAFYCLSDSLAYLVWTSPDTVMREPSLRFFVVEHSLQMFVALAMAHIGSALARKGRSDTQRHQRAALFFSISLLIAYGAIPWPWSPYERPLVRFGWGW
ncbi:hypothetical protein [Roseiflexus sp.]|uniref:hypothetical protein n=1 Tax=Roseiflexus sp. TaxID=2562120 RepID=UPI00398B94A1